LFNLRHSQCRNSIERIFGLVKRRFPILKTAPEYPFPSQIKLVLASTALYNIMRRHQQPQEFDVFADILGIDDDNEHLPEVVQSEENQAERHSTSGKFL